jgi:ribosome-associated protein
VCASSPVPSSPFRMSPSPAASLQLARRAATLCADMKAQDIVVLDVKGVSDVTDCFVIASGTSDAHVRGIANHVLEELDKGGSDAHHVEGLPQGRWVLLDYVDVVVHVFHPRLREFYQLERLWGDAEVVALEPQGAAT